MIKTLKADIFTTMSLVHHCHAYLNKYDIEWKKITILVFKICLTSVKSQITDSYVNKYDLDIVNRGWY